MNCERLQRFRQQAYELLGKAKDATFELADAVMTTRHAQCLGDFALNPLFRRQWSSAYEALQDCQPEREKLMRLYIEQMLYQFPKYLLSLNRRIVEFHYVVKECFEVIEVLDPGGISNIQAIEPVSHMRGLNLLNRQRNSGKKLFNSVVITLVRFPVIVG